MLEIAKNKLKETEKSIINQIQKLYKLNKKTKIQNLRTY